MLNITTSNKVLVPTMSHRPSVLWKLLGDVSFIEDDDGYFLLDEVLAKETGYIEVCNLIYSAYTNLNKAATGVFCFGTVVSLSTLLSFVCLALVPALVFTTHALPFPDLLHNIQRGRTTLSNVYGGLHLDGQRLKPSSV